MRRTLSIWLVLLGACGGATETDAGAPATAGVDDAAPPRTIALGRAFSCATTAAGLTHCWGALPGARGATPPTAVPELAGAVELSAWDAALCARMPGGRVVCWQRRLGPRPVAIPSLDGSTAIALDGARVCGIVSEEVRCAAFDGGVAASAEVRAVPGARGLAIGEAWACVRRAGAPALCGRTGDRAPTFDLAVRGTESAVALAIDGPHVWALGADGTVRRATLDGATEGEDAEATAEPDLAGVRAIAAGGGRYCAVTEAAVRCEDVPSRGAPPATHAGGQREVAVAGVGGHACFRDAMGGLACWGDNGDGQVTAPPAAPSTPTRLPLAHVVDVAVVDGAHRLSCALTEDGVAHCWDDGLVAERPVALHMFPPLRDLAASADGVCGRGPEGRVFCVRAGALARSPGEIADVRAPGGLLGGPRGFCALGARGHTTCFELAPGTRPFDLATGGLEAPFLAADQLCGTRRGALACVDVPSASTVRRGDRPEPGAPPPPGVDAARLPTGAVAEGRGARWLGGASQALAAIPDAAPVVVGENGAGELGLPRSAPLTSATASTFEAPVVGAAFARRATCAWGATGPLRCAGLTASLVPSAPRLGAAARVGWVEIPGPTGIRTASIGPSSCAVTDDGSLWCWGLPPRGDGPLLRHRSPVAVALP